MIVWPGGAGGPRGGAEIAGCSCSDLRLGDLCRVGWLFKKR